MRQIDNLAEAMELIISERTVKKVTFSMITFCKPIINVDFEECEFSNCRFSHEIASTTFKDCSFYNVKITDKIRRTGFHNSKNLDLCFNEAFIENCVFDNFADTERKTGPHHLNLINSNIYGTCFWNIAISAFGCENNYFNYCDFNNYEIKRFMDDTNFFYNCAFKEGTFGVIFGDGGTYANCKISRHNSQNFLEWFDPICPIEDSFIGYKKIVTYDNVGLKSYAIVKLQIPEDAKRTRSTFRKCRCDKAIVLSIVDAEGRECEEGYSHWDSSFRYKVGEEVVADEFDDNPYEICTHGIHFFMTKREAESYNWC